MKKENVIFSHNKLRGKIIEKYGTLNNFSEAYNISMNSLSQKLNNKMQFSRNDIVRISKLLDIKKEDIGAYFFEKQV